jgi:hypothetical protein
MKDSLFKLIHAMTRSEKRAFTLEAKQNHASPQYWELFNQISKMKEYDEEVLRRRFNSTNFSEDKAYLYDALLRSLRNYNSEQNLTRQIKNKVLDANYLFNAQMFDEAKDLLKQAEKMAKKIGDGILQLEINRDMRRVIKAHRSDDFEKELTEKIDEVPHIQKAIETDLLYLQINDELLITSNYSEKNRSESSLQATKDKYKPYFQNTSKPNALKTRFRYLQSYYLFASVTGDVKSLNDTIEEISQLWQENKFYQKEDRFAYIIDLGNLISSYLTQKKIQQIAAVLADLEAIEPKNVLEEVYRFRKLKILQLSYHLNMGIIKDFDKLEKEVRQGLIKHAFTKVAIRRAYFNLAILALMASDSKKCKKYCDWLTERDPNTDQIHLIISASLIKIMALYNLGDDRLDKYLRKVKGWMKQWKLQNLELKFETQVIDFFSQLDKTGQTDRRAIFKDFLEYLPSISSSIGDTHELLTYWIIEKTQNKPIWQQIRALNIP